MKTHPGLLVISALPLMAADPIVGAAQAPAEPIPPTPAPAPAEPAMKLYLASAQAKKAAADAKPGDPLPTASFVVEAIDYKTAWAYAREVTRVGDAYFEGSKVWTDADRTTALKMAPGQWTVHEVKSLQERASKTNVISADALIEELNSRGVKIPQSLLDTLATLKGAGEQPTAEPVRAAG